MNSFRINYPTMCVKALRMNCPHTALNYITIKSIKYVSIYIYMAPK